MYNLIMKGMWTKGRDSFSLGRVFEYTDEEIEAAHQTAKKPDLDRMMRYPCLFMEEGTNEEQAFVGYITSAKIVGAGNCSPPLFGRLEGRSSRGGRFFGRRWPSDVSQGWDDAAH